MIWPFNQVLPWDSLVRPAQLAWALNWHGGTARVGDDIWLVTHMDLHKMTKVQAMIQHIKTWARELDLRRFVDGQVLGL